MALVAGKNTQTSVLSSNLSVTVDSATASNNMQNQSPVASYATVSRQSHNKKKINAITDFPYPDDEQGIVFSSIPNTTIKQYLLAMKSKVKDAKNIIAASRISRDRILIFLKSRELVQTFYMTLVQTFIDEGASIEINNEIIRGKCLRSSAKKIIFSNVSASIPNSVLNTYIVDILKFKLASLITFLRMDPPDEEFAHIISGRRQVYISNYDDINPPGSFSLQYNNHMHRIFINFDEPTCYLCKSSTHKAAECTTYSDSELKSIHEAADSAEHKDIESSSAAVSPPPLWKWKNQLHQTCSQNPNKM